jgi:hypothetical protein
MPCSANEANVCGNLAAMADHVSPQHVGMAAQTHATEATGLEPGP